MSGKLILKENFIFSICTYTYVDNEIVPLCESTKMMTDEFFYLEYYEVYSEIDSLLKKIKIVDEEPQDIEFGIFYIRQDGGKYGILF